MADKAISELLAANQVTPTDLFVLEQSGVAKKLTGQTLENWLLSFADGHGGIQSIVKKGTSGLVDTYRITLADTTTFDFTVTNGKAISSVGQTSVSGLTRTYTIAFNDGTSQTFKVTDGRSITNIAKTGTNGLTDTYTISYNDGTSSTFTVKNGKGIQSFAKVSTDGLVDTYRIEYNDGTFDEFTVTNGAKGDQGDNTYTHIKFASQEPTEASHSFGDVPDKWIGFYWGNSSTAPTDWTQYKWYQFKGDKGDTGEPATLVSSEVRYQASDSGTIIPSGTWSSSVPVVAQGKYLWTRTTQNFNTGSPVASYSVSRMGLDGTGSVSAVANISPDADGNVPLTAENIGAVSSTGGDLTGELRMNGQQIKGLNAPTENDQAANMGFVNQQVRKAAPHNLLDNSNFRNPVNQRGQTTYTGYCKALDRYMIWGDGNDCTLTVHDGYIHFSGGSGTGTLSQLFEYGVLDSNKTYTMAYKKLDGEIVVAPASISYGYMGCCDMATICGTTNSSEDIVWAALYEGEYTAETLPEYQPKGYAVELAECQRYLLMGNPMGIVTNRWDNTVGFCIPTPVTMRSGSPTVFGNFFVNSTDNTSVRLNCQIAVAVSASNNVYLYCVLDDATAAQKACSFNFEAGGGLSMEL